MSFRPSPLASHCMAEHTLLKPSNAVWLRSLRLRTCHFEETLEFYVTLIGLTLREVTVHPTTCAMTAHLVGAEGEAVIQLVEATPDSPGFARRRAAGHELGIAMPRRTWQLLRARLERRSLTYTDCADALCFSDPDGTRLRVEPVSA